MANKNFKVRHGLDVDGNIAATDLTLSGNLTVNGTTTTLNTETLSVEDNIVVLNSNVTGTPTTDAGIEVERGDSTNSAVTWKESDDKWYQNRGGIETVIPVSTTELTEGTNQYFTQARARQSVSVTDSGGDGSLSYDNSTGVITYTGPSATEVRAHFSGGTGISITSGSVAVDFTEFDTDEITEGTTNLYYTDGRVTTRINNTSIDALSDVVITSPVAGHQFSYNGTNWVNGNTVSGANLNRFARAVDGTGSNVSLAISRNRADAARAVDGGPTLGFEYVGTDNTQATSFQNAIQSRYQTSGNHQMRFMQGAGDYNAQTLIAQLQRGNFLFNNTSGGQHLLLSDSTAVLRGTTTSITNNANTTTYATFAAAGHSMGGVDAPITVNRVATAAGNRPVQFVRNQVPGTTTPAGGDGASYRLQVAGSNGTPYNLAQISSTYGATGDTNISFDIANGDQNTSTMTTLQMLNVKLSETRIKGVASPTATAGGNTATDVAIFTPALTTFKTDAVTLQNNSGTALTSAGVNYTRTYGEFAYTAGAITPAAPDTVYALPLDTTNASSGTSISNTSRINITTPGWYKIIMSLQVKNADNAADHTLRFWLRKNGTDVANSGTLVTPLKLQEQVIAMDWLVNSDGDDYWEIAYYVNDTDVTFPNYTSISSPVTAPSCPPIIINVIPIGM